MLAGCKFDFYKRGVIVACLNVIGSRDLLMIVANVDARNSMLAWVLPTSLVKRGVESGSSSLDVVGHFLATEITPL